MARHDLRVLGVDRKLVGVQDIGDRERCLYDAFAIDVRESAELITGVVADAVAGREGQQFITDQGTPYLAEVAQQAYDAIGVEHAPQREGAPTEKSTVERVLHDQDRAGAELTNLHHSARKAYRFARTAHGSERRHAVLTDPRGLHLLWSSAVRSLSHKEPLMMNSSALLHRFGAAFVFSCLLIAGASTAGAEPLTLQNGWTAAPFSTGTPAVVPGNVVYFRGAIAGGTSPVAFTLPVELRPEADVYVPVDLCNATKGRLFIAGSSGIVSVQAEGGAFSNAQCFTSLEGASYAVASSQWTTLALKNGWTNAPFGTRNAAVANRGGIIHFGGAIAGGNGSPFTLPRVFTPAQNVYVAVDLCGATNGRLFIEGGTGIVTVQAENGASRNAQCFTSLDGASFVLDVGPGLVPINGWSGALFGTRGPAAVPEFESDGRWTVHLSGAIATGGTNATALVLAPGLIPANDTYLPIDLCNATKGRLIISSATGAVSVQAENGAFSNAQCFTSLDGAFYSL